MIDALLFLAVLCLVYGFWRLLNRIAEAEAGEQPIRGRKPVDSPTSRPDPDYPRRVQEVPKENGDDDDIKPIEPWEI